MAARLTGLLPRLNERDRRLAMATEAKSWGRGGIVAVHKATGGSKTTIRRGIAELDSDTDTADAGRVRAHGGGRKRADVANPGLEGALESLIEPGTRGDPESPLRWTTKSTRKLANELTAMGHAISHTVVGKLLHSSGYSPAEHPQDPGRGAAPRPRRPVQIHQHPGRRVPGSRGPGDQHRYLMWIFP